MGFDLTTPTDTDSLINTKPTIEERFHALRQRIVVLEHELHGDLRLARPLRVRRRAAVADQVAGIVGGFHGVRF